MKEYGASFLVLLFASSVFAQQEEFPSQQAGVL